MPNIQEYNAGSGRLEPEQGGQEAYVQSGRRIGTFFHQSGDILGSAIARVGEQEATRLDQQQAQAQILDANAKLSQIDTASGQSWHDTTRAKDFDPNNDAAGQGAIEQHQAATAALLDNVSNSRAKEHLLAQVDASNRAFSSRVRADQSNLAGFAAEQNYNTVLNNYAADVHDNPEAFEARLQQFQDTIQAYSDNHHAITGEEAARLKTATLDHGSNILAMSSAKGLIDANPEEGLKEINSGRFKDYLTGENRQQLDGYARSVQRLNDEKQKAADTELRRNQTEAARDASNNLVGATIQQDGTMKITPNYFEGVKQYMSMPGADPGTGRAMFELGQRMQADKYTPIRPSPGVLNSYLTRLGTDNPPTDKEILANTEVKGGLTMEESNFIRSRMKPTAENKFETDNINDTRTMIRNQFPNLQDPIQAQNAQAAQSWFLKEYQEGLKRGWSAQSMTDPTDPHFLMTPDKMKQFTTLKGDALLNAMRSMTGETEKRMGKSITEFMNGQ